MDIIYNDYYCLNADKSKEGGFARIIKVKHKDLGYVRALKVLNAHVFKEDDKVYQTFLKECMTLLKIGNGCHPNIVRIYRPRLINQSAVVEMDYVNGETLEEYLERVKFMPIDEIYKFIRQIGGALAYCHEDIYLDQMDWEIDNLQPDPKDARLPLIDEAKRQELIKNYRVVHNDLHSANVMRRHYDGDFILLDFGLAIQNGVCVKSSSRRDGAPEYKSPEKWENLNVETPQNDIYSFGVLLYKALTGQEPFPLDKIERETRPEKAINDVREMHLHKDPPAIGPKREAAFKAAYPGQLWRRDYPDWLETMVMKCLEKDPQKRYGTAKELVNEFRRHLAEDHTARAFQAESEQIQALKAENISLKQRCDELTSQLREVRMRHTTSSFSQPGSSVTPNAGNKTIEFQTQSKSANTKMSNAAHIADVSKPGTFYSWLRKSSLYIAAIILGLLGGVWFSHGNPVKALSDYLHRETVNADSLLQIGINYYNQDPRELDKAFIYFQQAAEAGNADAQNWLGYCYEFGQGVDRDSVEAVNWYRKSANQGHASAQNNLGNCYYNGKGVNQDYTEAVNWYRKSVAQGNAYGEYDLGNCYFYGNGVKQDYAEAVKWYRKSADQGYADAQNMLGRCYEEEWGVNKDYTEAVNWYRKSANQGHASAQNNLGNCYYNGKGVKKDYTEAVNWYRKSVAQGNAYGEYDLGNCYFYGNGVNKDYAEAVTWYRKAADQGHASAQNKMGQCYEYGKGVPKDLNEAVKWYRKAAEQGHEVAKSALKRLDK